MNATPEARQPKTEPIDPNIFSGLVNEKVLDQIKGIANKGERAAYTELLRAMLEKNPNAIINDLEDVRIPGIAPALPGTDRAKTMAVRAVDMSKLKRKQEEASGVRETPEKYTEGMTLKDKDLTEIGEEEAAKIEQRLKTKIQGYDPKKSIQRDTFFP